MFLWLWIFVLTLPLVIGILLPKSMVFRESVKKESNMEMFKAKTVMTTDVISVKRQIPIY